MELIDRLPPKPKAEISEEARRIIERMEAEQIRRALRERRERRERRRRSR